MYEYNRDGVHRTFSYNNWIRYFPIEEVPSKEDYEIWEGIDFSKPISIYIRYVCKDKIDVRNLDKAIIDMLFNRCLKVDDNIVDVIKSERVGTCDSFTDGRISFYIRNV